MAPRQPVSVTEHASEPGWERRVVDGRRGMRRAVADDDAVMGAPDVFGGVGDRSAVDEDAQERVDVIARVALARELHRGQATSEGSVLGDPRRRPRLPLARARSRGGS